MAENTKCISTTYLIFDILLTVKYVYTLITDYSTISKY
jgi:hypothetical protein